MNNLDEILSYLEPNEQEELISLLDGDTAVWRPLPGPQMQAYYSEADIIGYGGAAGGGKGLALDTPIPTLDGFKPMREIAVGDTVFDEKGKPCCVVQVSGVQNRTCYRLVFDDESELVADDVHRWVTFNAKELGQLTKLNHQWRAKRRAKRISRATGNKSERFTQSLIQRNQSKQWAYLPTPTGTVRSTQEIANTLLTDSGRKNHAIAVCQAVHYPEKSLLVPPYVLGAWLGDGASANGQITSIDPEMWQRIEQEGYRVVHYAWNQQQHNIIGLKIQLRHLGVLGNKHIPELYLQGSYEQRLALLQGLMDADGHCTLKGGCEFDNINERLIDGVLTLLHSLGIKATKRKGLAKLQGRVIGNRWRIKFTTTLPVFHLKRKKDRLPQTVRRTTQFRYVVSCEEVLSVPTQCIAVDSPSRQYLAGKQFIPTHNTDLACGKAITQHTKVMILRRIGTELTGIVDRLEELLGSSDGFNSQKGIWRPPSIPHLQIELGAVQNVGDEKKYQGRPHDLLVFDEATYFQASQVRFLLGWLRTTKAGQKCQALLTFNPPTTAEGRWVIDFFAPWLDKKFPNPAQAGEIRYAASLPANDLYPNGRDLWLDRADPFVLVDGEPVYDFDKSQYAPQDIIKPMSRTFIPSRITDNPYLLNTGYLTTLQGLPEPLRSQMLNGDFSAGVEDDVYQVIPTAWVEQAQARWKKPSPLPPMDSLGVDIARGGKDSTVIARRHGMWFDEPIAYTGSQTPNGPQTAGLILSARRNEAVIHLDVIGVGASPYDFLNETGVQVVGVNVAESATRGDLSGRLQFKNLRTQLWWQMREALDPDNNTGICLPPDPKLLADLCAPRWKMTGATIQVESRDEIIKRIGRSPDYGSAYILALMDTPKLRSLKVLSRTASAYDPYEHIRQDYDPYAQS